MYGRVYGGVCKVYAECTECTECMVECTVECTQSVRWSVQSYVGVYGGVYRVYGRAGFSLGKF